MQHSNSNNALQVDISYSWFAWENSQLQSINFIMSSLFNRYVAGKLKIITNQDAKGLNTYVGTFALPAIIFTSLINLHWDTVNWLFLLAILISKCVVFFAVGIVSLLLSKPLDFGKAAILAIFCTQSNDFAIGAPIINALYDKNHKEYEAYLFLMAPLSLAILNPIGYVLLEWSNVRKNTKKVNAFCYFCY